MVFEKKQARGTWGIQEGRYKTKEETRALRENKRGEKKVGHGFAKWCAKEDVRKK